MTRSTAVNARQFVAFIVPGGFEETMILPKAICKELESAVPRCAKLKRGSLAIDVSITLNVVKGYYQFDQGWSDFVVHHNIREFDMLLFEHTGGMNFDVGVFNKSGEERTAVNNENNAVYDVENCSFVNEVILDQHTRPADVDDTPTPYFEVKVTPNTKYCAFITKSFIHLTHIDEQTAISVRNDKGFIWELGVKKKRKPCAGKGKGKVYFWMDEFLQGK